MENNMVSEEKQIDMKKVMKWVLISLGSLVGIVASVLVFISIYLLVSDFFYTDPNKGSYIQTALTFIK